MMSKDVVETVSFRFLERGVFDLKESEFQAKLKKEILERLPGAIVVKNETYMLGFPDLTVYYGERWAALECKRSANAAKQPNQQMMIDRMNLMGGFARFIYPENCEEVLNELQQTLAI